MRGFLAFLVGCALVAGLTLIDPDTARWFALAILGVLFVASAVPRRSTSRPVRRSAQPPRSRGTFDSQ